MPLDLPPGLPPQFGDAATLEERHVAAEGRAIEVQVAGKTVLIDGNSYLSEKRIRKAASAVDTAPKFILLLNALYAAAGYPFVNVEYAQDPESGIIYISVHEGYLGDVEAPPLLAPYFKGFEDQADLTQQDLEAKRILAEIKAKRAGYKVSAEYRISDADPAAFILDLDAEPDPEHKAARFSTVFGNPGNRFLGRFFGFGNAKYHTSGGDVIGLDYGTAFTGLGDTRGGEAYDRTGLSYSTATPYGLYNASASYTEYELGDRFGFQETEHAEIFQAGLEGSQFLYASDKTRWLLSERIEFTDSIIEFTEAPISSTLPDGTLFPVEGQRSQDERYAALRLGSTLTRSWTFFGRPSSIKLGGTYKRGFGGEIENLLNTERRTDFNIFAGEFDLSYRLPLSIVASLLLEGQLSIDREVPQQEQWVLGGPDRLSAFLPGVLVGDSGAYGRFELKLPRWELFGPASLRFSLFVEGGTAEFENRTGSTAAVRAAADAGVKLEVKAADWLELTAHAAESISERNMEIFPGPEAVRDNEADFFFSVKLRF